MKKFVLVICVLGLAACTSKAGPFVTNISSDGAGGIVIEKCMASLQRQLSTMESSDCTSSNIKLQSPYQR